MIHMIRRGLEFTYNSIVVGATTINVVGDTTMALLGYHIDVVGSVGMMQFAGKMMQNDASTL